MLHPFKGNSLLVELVKSITPERGNGVGENADLQRDCALGFSVEPWIGINRQGETVKMAGGKRGSVKMCSRNKKLTLPLEED